MTHNRHAWTPRYPVVLLALMAVAVPLVLAAVMLVVMVPIRWIVMAVVL